MKPKKLHPAIDRRLTKCGEAGRAGSHGEIGKRIARVVHGKRTRTDLVAYLPPEPLQRDRYNDDFQVEFTRGGDLLAIWT